MRKVIATVLIGIAVLTAAPAYSELPRFPEHNGSYTTSDGSFKINCTSYEDKRWCRFYSDKYVREYDFDIYVESEFKFGMKFKFYGIKGYEAHNVVSKTKIIPGVFVKCMIQDRDRSCRLFISPSVKMISVTAFSNKRWDSTFTYWPDR